MACLALSVSLRQSNGVPKGRPKMSGQRLLLIQFNSVGFHSSHSYLIVEAVANSHSLYSRSPHLNNNGKYDY